MAGFEFYHRTDLAQAVAKQVLATSIISASSSGLFLAAPRRTGKSTFMREDLRPALEKQGALVVYVDMWADKKLDPGVAIVTAVRAELSKYEGVITKLARQSGLDKVSVGGTAFSLDRVGLGADVTLSAALSALSDEVKTPIVLLIDEAQHAITTDGGYDALFALKAARDELNSSSHHGLRVIATGSNRAKLAMLRNSQDQAFYGAPLKAFPPLGKDFVEWFCENVDLAAPLDPAAVFPMFVRAGHRPEILAGAADSLRYESEIKPADVPALFAQAVEEQIVAADNQLLRIVHALTPLQSAVLRVLAVRGDKYGPFEGATLEDYRVVLKCIDPDSQANVDTQSAQAALNALREKSLVWKEKRGVYELEEGTLVELMANCGMLTMVPG
jgi:hypothetical protein